MTHQIRQLVGTFSIVVLLAACGGGGGGSSPLPPALGSPSGTLNYNFVTDSFAGLPVTTQSQLDAARTAAQADGRSRLEYSGQVNVFASTGETAEANGTATYLPNANVLEVGVAQNPLMPAVSLAAPVTETNGTMGISGEIRATNDRQFIDGEMTATFHGPNLGGIGVELTGEVSNLNQGVLEHTLEGFGALNR
ncbi:MAG: hypothetical protein AAGF71_02290 [Pseudomonadota bacterium]